MKIQLQKTLLGRTLRRLAGEEKGAVMMEYVVLGVLLVAAVVGAVIVFSRGTGNACDIMTKTVAGDPNAAKDAAESARTEAGEGTEQSDNFRHEVVNTDIP